jgi:hypothetical protein
MFLSIHLHLPHKGKALIIPISNGASQFRVVHYNVGNIHIRTSPLTGENKVEEGGADETFHTKGSGRGDPMKCQ